MPPSKKTVTVLESEMGAVDISDVGIGKMQQSADWGLPPLAPLPEATPEEYDELDEAADRIGAILTESPLEAPAAPMEPERPPMHPLDLAPVNSKIVVTTEGAWLAQPSGAELLTGPDPARRLPVGAKIIKVENGYLSTQLSPAQPSEPRFYKSALEAIKNFVEDHHPRN